MCRRCRRSLRWRRGGCCNRGGRSGRRHAGPVARPAIVGGPSGPTLFDQVGTKSVGPEGPPTHAERSCNTRAGEPNRRIRNRRLAARRSRTRRRLSRAASSPSPPLHGPGNAPRRVRSGSAGASRRRR
ncbi:DUF6053 domain-containing protein [Lysobacter enzymogenes]|uniref:DUF6053 domain-containing protein n=1 Tax=Lysobacter enzymogenes TaxID=69 RepID=UPI003D1898F4